MIIAVGILGVLLAVFQGAYLIMTRLAVSAQLRNLNESDARTIRSAACCWRSAATASESKAPELAELRISEAVLREVPAPRAFPVVLAAWPLPPVRCWA